MKKHALGPAFLIAILTFNVSGKGYGVGEDTFGSVMKTVSLGALLSCRDLSESDAIYQKASVDLEKLAGEGCRRSARQLAKWSESKDILGVPNYPLALAYYEMSLEGAPEKDDVLSLNAMASIVCNSDALSCDPAHDLEAHGAA